MTVDKHLKMKREIKLPLTEAFRISLEQIVKRRTRTFIMILSIALGTSYLTYFLTSNAIFSSYLESMNVEAYNLGLIIVSIIVCSVSLVNSTLISVMERYKEIGAMKCLGALDQHILSFILIEALLIGLVGGVLGFTVGMIGSLISCYFEFGFIVFQKLPLIRIIIFFGLITVLSVGLNIVSVVYPAIRAARLNPVEALRYEG